MNSAVTALRSLAHLLGLGQDADDLCVEVCYSVHVASVGTVIPASHTVGFYVKRLVGIRKRNASPEGLSGGRILTRCAYMYF